MKNQKKAYIFALLSVFFWSTVATAFKITLKNMDYSMLILYSVSFSFICLLIILILQKKIYLVSDLSKKQIIESALLGLLNPFLYYLILFKAYSLLTAQLALTLNYTWAIMVVLLSIPLLKQKIKSKSILSILISFFGVIVIATKGDIINFQITNGIGVALALSSSFLWAFYWILNTKDTLDSILRLTLNFFFGLIYSILSSIFIFDFQIPSIEGLIGSAYIGFFEMGITFFLWLNALKYSTTTAKVSNLIYLSPFFSLFFINLILGEKIEPFTVVGLIFIIFGIILQSKQKNS